MDKLHKLIIDGVDVWYVNTYDDSGVFAEYKYGRCTKVFIGTHVFALVSHYNDFQTTYVIRSLTSNFKVSLDGFFNWGTCLKLAVLFVKDQEEKYYESQNG